MNIQLYSSRDTRKRNRKIPLPIIPVRRSKTGTPFADLTRDGTEEFYKGITREVAEDLLDHKQNGTFIIRPSKNSLGTLSVVQDNRIFHLSIRKRQDGLIALGNEKSNEKCFKDIDSLINYYISNYLVLCSNGEKSLTLLLPYRDKNIIP